MSNHTVDQHNNMVDMEEAKEAESAQLNEDATSLTNEDETAATNEDDVSPKSDPGESPYSRYERLARRAKKRGRTVDNDNQNDDEQEEKQQKKSKLEKLPIERAIKKKSEYEQKVKKVVESYREAKQYLLCFQEDLGSNGAKQYGFGTLDFVWEEIKRNNFRNATFNEDFILDRPCKPFLDVEFAKQLNPNISGSQMSQHIIALWDEWWSRTYPTQQQPFDLLCCCASDEQNKASYHIIRLNSGHYPCLKDQETDVKLRFIPWLTEKKDAGDLRANYCWIKKSEDNKSFGFVVDEGVYKAKRCFRMLWCDKTGQNRPFRLLRYMQDIDRNKLNPSKLPESFGKDVFTNSLIMNIPHNSDKLVVPAHMVLAKAASAKATINQLQPADALRILTMCGFPNDMVDCKIEKHDGNDWHIDLKSVGTNFCPIKAGNHNHCKVMVRINEHNLMLICKSESCSQQQNKAESICKTAMAKLGDIPLLAEMVTRHDLFRGDLGWEAICIRKFGQNVVVSDKKSYIWNEDKRLWCESHDVAVKNLISPTLEEVVMDQIKKHQAIVGTEQTMEENSNAKEEEVEEEEADEMKQQKRKLRQLATLLGHVRQQRYVGGVFERLQMTLQRPGQKFNDDPDSIPTKGGMLVNLKTKIVRARTRNDYFTFECPVSYIPDPDDQALQQALERGTSSSSSSSSSSSDTINSSSVSGNRPYSSESTPPVVIRRLASKSRLAKRHPRMCRFMIDIFEDDEELILQRQKELGYMITGRYAGRVFWIWHGPGMNGKGTLRDLLSAVLERWYAPINKDTVIKAKGKSVAGAASPHLISLQHIRLGVFAETEDGDCLNAGLLKSLSGGDAIEARDVHKSSVSFLCRAKLSVQSNCVIRFDLHDQAMSDRVIIWLFENRFVKNPDPNNKNEKPKDETFIGDLKSKYLDEVFSFFVDGAYEWYKDGGGQIVPNKHSRETFKKYVAHVDSVTKFLDTKYQITKESTDKVECSDLIDKYRMWCRDEDEPPVVGSKQFGRNMKLQLGTDTITNHGKRYYIGLKCKPQP